MTKTQAISRFTELVPKLSDEQLESILELSGYLAQSEGGGNLSEVQRASIAAGLRDVRDGRLVEADTVHADIASRIAKARGKRRSAIPLTLAPSSMRRSIIC